MLPQNVIVSEGRFSIHPSHRAVAVTADAVGPGGLQDSDPGLLAAREGCIVRWIREW